MIRTILKPDKNSLTLQLPDELVGKMIEVIAFSIEETKNTSQDAASKTKRIDAINNVLNKHRVDLSNYKFDRDEANDYCWMQ